MILMPKGVNDMFQKLMEEKHMDKKKAALMDIAIVMERHLLEIDSQIEDLLNK